MVLPGTIGFPAWNLTASIPNRFAPKEEIADYLHAYAEKIRSAHTLRS